MISKRNTIEEVLKGHEMIVEITDETIDLKAFLVIDNTARGTALGGVRMSSSVNEEEVKRLSRAMTLKCAMANIPHGGCKSGIICPQNIWEAFPSMKDEMKNDPQLRDRMEQVLNDRKAVLISAFTERVKDLNAILAPDMGSGEQQMAIAFRISEKVTGIPEEIGGLSIDENGFTAFGLIAAIEQVRELDSKLLPQSPAVCIQGFGAVGSHASKFAFEKGMLVVGVSTTEGALYDPRGLDVYQLLTLRETCGDRCIEDYHSSSPTLIRYPKIHRNNILVQPMDVFIPAAGPDIIATGHEIDANNLDSINVLDFTEKSNCLLIVEGANIPITMNAETILHEKGIIVLPDFLVNPGGLIGCFVEFRRGTIKQTLELIETTVDENVIKVFKRSRDRNISPRAAATQIALLRVHKAMQSKDVLQKIGCGAYREKSITQTRSWVSENEAPSQVQEHLDATIEEVMVS